MNLLGKLALIESGHYGVGIEGIRKAAGEALAELTVSREELKQLRAFTESRPDVFEAWKLGTGHRLHLEAICPQCRGEGRYAGYLCRRCNGNAQIPRSELKPGEIGAFETADS